MTRDKLAMLCELVVAFSIASSSAPFAIIARIVSSIATRALMRFICAVLRPR